MNDHPVVIVTGASRGMGKAAAAWLAKAGARLTLAARSSESLAQTSRELETKGAEVLTIPADVAEQEECEKIVRLTVERFGKIDAVVNNAGVLTPIAPVAESDPRQWLYTMKVNLFGPYVIMRAALPHLRKTGGRIVNVSSGAAVKAFRSWSAYCVSKAGLTHLTAVIAAEEPNVIAISLRPGVVDTSMQELIRAEGPKSMPPDMAAHFQSLKDDNMLEPPEVPGRSIAWLALRAPHELSGQFVEYDDPRVTEPAKKLLGTDL